MIYLKNNKLKKIFELFYIIKFLEYYHKNYYQLILKNRCFLIF